jgi:hypothetical protein
MAINVKKVLAAGAAEKAKPKPKPKVLTSSPSIEERAPAPIWRDPEAITDQKRAVDLTSDKEFLLKDLWEQMHVVKTERGKLSSRTAYLVDELAAKIRKEEGPAVEAEFWKGNIAMPEIAEHYALIQSWTDKATALYDQIKHVELYGALPPERQPGELVGSGKTIDAKALSADIRALDKLISKTNAKLVSGLKPKNKARVLMWKEKIERAKIQREDLKRKLNALQYEARAQRTGE